MRVRVVKTTPASPDGITVLTYQAGTVVDMPAGLAAVFLREGWGEAVGEDRPKPGPEQTQALPGPAETKPAPKRTSKK